ncbi:MAG: C10 family peptidase, partial [Prevotella sp.]
MKKLLLLLACALIGLTAQAEKITEQEALLKARQFMHDRQFKHSGMLRAPQRDAASPGYYVFNAEDEGGFVIVAGDDRMRSILGYAEKGSFNQESLPDNIKWLLDFYAQVADSLPAGQTGNAPAASASRPELQPLLTTTWDQFEPYNAHCPEVEGYLPPTGCVATAMAQVIYYFQWPINEVRSMADYTTNSLQINVPGLPARKIGWYNMTDDEIAWLMRYCGQSVQMDYMPAESGARAIDIAGALVSVFNFSRTANLAIRQSYSDEQWEELIYNELNVGHPVIYNGDAGNGVSGHSFVLHGYKDGLFCVNWGWSGQCDGYFALTNLSPNDSQ